MEFQYGNGVYLEGEKKLEGKITLGEHRLFLKADQGELAQTYVPLEKIFEVKLSSLGLELGVRPSLAYKYKVVFKGEKVSLKELAKDLVGSRGFKKRFLKNEWFEEEN